MTEFHQQLEEHKALYKMAARRFGGLGHLKVAEECCEVLLAETPEKLEAEEWDLLMSLIDLHMQDGPGMVAWKAKMDAQARTMTSDQQEFYDFFVNFQT